MQSLRIYFACFPTPNFSAFPPQDAVPPSWHGIGRRCAAADRIADSRVDRTRPIAKIWMNGLSVSCDTTRAPARRLNNSGGKNNRRALRLIKRREEQLPHRVCCCLIEDLVQSLNLGPIWQASDSLSPRAPGSARRPFLKFAPEPRRQDYQLPAHRKGLELHGAPLSSTCRDFEWRLDFPRGSAREVTWNSDCLNAVKGLSPIVLTLNAFEFRQACNLWH